MSAKNVCTECGYIAGVLASPWNYSLCCHVPTEQMELDAIPNEKRRLNPVYKRAGVYPRQPGDVR